MSTDRRMIAQSRRRRVIYQTSLEEGPETAAERRAAERLREARRPTAHYGSHVRRRLRGRWFSLVPVNRLAMSGSAGMILGLAMLLCLMHYLSVTWAPLALREELARPFRLDRPDSFGTYTRAIFLFAAAGTALLVYQLRRYKVDDYKGHYRLWRPVILLLLLMSIDCVCGLVSWAGAVIDASIGKRIAMAGANWLRIVMAVGGIVLAVRLLAEVHRSRLSLAMMTVAVASWCAPLLGYWNLYDLNSFRGWMTTTTSPLIAAATFWVATGAYLRMLFRDVRGLNDTADESAATVPLPRSKRHSVEDVYNDEPRGWLSWFRKPTPEAEEPADAPEKRRKRIAVARLDEDDADDATVTSNPEKAKADAAPKRRWLGLRGAAKATSASKESDLVKNSSSKERTAAKDPAQPTRMDEAPKKPTANQPSVESTPKKRWFGRGSKSTGDETKPVVKPPANKELTSPADKTDKPKRSWLGFGKSASGAKEDTAKPATKPAAPVPAKEAATAAPAKKSGLGGWLSRSKSTDANATAATANRGPAAPVSKAPAAVQSKPTQQTSYASSDDSGDEYDEDDGENSSMSKADRRRLRKEARRSGRAA